MIEPHQTRDGGLIVTGRRYYLHARLHDPTEPVTLVGYATSGRSWLDGSQVAIWKVRSETSGEEFLAEAWQLSREPIEELVRQLTERLERRR